MEQSSVKISVPKTAKKLDEMHQADIWFDTKKVVLIKYIVIMTSKS
jgi:hypothetical protein